MRYGSREEKCEISISTLLTFRLGKIIHKHLLQCEILNRLIWILFSIKFYDGFFNFDSILSLQTIDERSTFETCEM